MFLALCVEDDLRRDMSVSMPWSIGRRRVVVEGQRSVQVFGDLRGHASTTTDASMSTQ